MFVNKMSSVTVACDRYAITSALCDGKLEIPGVKYVTLAIADNPSFTQMLRDLPFECSEISLSSYTMAKFANRSFTAIPVFTHRKFMHRYILCHKDSKIREPRDLNGKKVGLSRYQVTAAVWAKGLLQHDYDVDLSKIHWFTANFERVEFNPSVEITMLPKGRSIDSLLRSGELDAAIFVGRSSLLDTAADKINRLFPDYVDVEKDYFRRTGIFPPIHTIAIRNNVIIEEPGSPKKIYEVFERAKSYYYEWLNSRSWNYFYFPYAWIEHLIDQENSLLGNDPFEYGLQHNSRALTALYSYQVEQGLIPSEPTPETMFAHV